MNIDSKKILDDVRANLAILDSCSDHDFEIPAPFTARHARCRRCGGTIDAMHARWYQRGRQHERASAQSVSTP